MQSKSNFLKIYIEENEKISINDNLFLVIGKAAKTSIRKSEKVKKGSKK